MKILARMDERISNLEELLATAKTQLHLGSAQDMINAAVNIAYVHGQLDDSVECRKLISDCMVDLVQSVASNCQKMN